MGIFDYINLVSGYIINKFENKRDSFDALELSIKPVRDPYNNELSYEVREFKNYKEQVFFMKFVCNNKQEFYNALFNLLIQYLKNSDLIVYTATNENGYEKLKFSIVIKNRATVSFIAEDEADKLIYDEFKTYLDEKKKNLVSEELYEIEEIMEKEDDIKTYNKIML